MPFAVQPSYKDLVDAQNAPNAIQNILNSAMQGYSAYQTAQESKQKREKDQIDTYAALRKAGYSIHDAHKRTLAGLGLPEPSETLEEKKTKADIAKTERDALGGEITPNRADDKKTQKINALSLIESAAGKSKAYIESEIRDNYPHVQISDPEIQAAIQTAAYESDSKSDKGPGFIDKAKVTHDILKTASKVGKSIMSKSKKRQKRTGQTSSGVRYTLE